MSSLVTVLFKPLSRIEILGKSGVKRHSHPEGFTLIEGLVTLLLVGIFAAILTPSFMGWLNSRRIEDVTAQVESALKEAQAEAQKRSLSCAVEISPTAITANPTACFPTGSKDLTKLGVTVLTKNHSGTTLASNLRLPARFEVSYRGNISLPSPSAEAIITVFQQGSTQGRCLAVTSGIGIMRRGKYVGQNPASPAPNECETVES
jgi:prepilin-type N-terminal cleavage/methylation domain-containing protein